MVELLRDLHVTHEAAGAFPEGGFYPVWRPSDLGGGSCGAEEEEEKEKEKEEKEKEEEKEKDKEEEKEKEKMRRKHTHKGGVS